MNSQKKLSSHKAGFLFYNSKKVRRKREGPYETETEDALGDRDSARRGVPHRGIRHQLDGKLGADGITYVLLHAVTTPIGVLCSLMEKIAGGDLTTHLPASSRSDEIGALQNSCRDMMTSLQTMVKTAKEAADHVSESSEELTASSS